MQYIYTTQSAVDTLKKTAKKAVKEFSSFKLATVLEQEAKKAGYEDYNHLTQCFKKTQLMELGWAPPLPEEYVVWFERYNSQLTKHTQSIFNNDFIFGFDVKDSDENIDHECFEGIPDAWLLCGQDIARLELFSAYEDELGIARCAFDIYNEEENMERIQDELMNYRYFRAIGANAPQKLEAISVFLKDKAFFYPRLIWHKGMCLNLRTILKH